MMVTYQSPDIRLEGRIRIKLDGDASVSLARKGVRGLLRELDAKHSIDDVLANDVAIVASELSTNAVRYADGGEFTATYNDVGTIRIEIEDNGGGALEFDPQMPSTSALGGRGLGIVVALSHRYGIIPRNTRPDQEGKIVWAEIDVWVAQVA